VISPMTDLSAPVGAPLTKTVVLDTSVLVADPGAIHEFGGCALNVPLTVIEELDGLRAVPTAWAGRPVTRCGGSRP